MAKQNLLTQSQIDEICLAYDDCHNQIEVARRTKHSITTVSKYLIASGRGCGQGHNQKKKITDQQILDGIAEGLTRQQIADRHGVHVENLAKRMRKLGVHAKHAPMVTDSPFGDCWHYVRTQDEKIREVLPDFQYLESRKCRIRLRCRSCGKVIERDKKTVCGGSVRCEHCEEAQRAERALNDKRIVFIRILCAVSESKTPKQCTICGETFYSQYKNALYCSDKCRKRHQNKRKKSFGKGIRYRCRKYGVYYDPSVTAKKIFERDHYQCKICGLFCIEGDTSWNGYFGPYSPTVDHIVALANGGTHTWDNVQCAHAICNSKKRDLITV